MTQNSTTFALRGGLDLTTPAIALPPGRVVAGVNYEPDYSGYRRSDGYERFDGRNAPSSGSSPAEIASFRTAIQTVPGVGPVRGVWIYGGRLWAFRDNDNGEGGMYGSGTTGWVQQSFGSTLSFSTGTAAFQEGQIVVGGTSAATGTIRRVVTQSGVYTGTAAGYLVLSGMVGTFATGEAVTSSTGAAVATTILPIALTAGGKYEFVNHNFYGSTKLVRMYFVNGGQTAFEWDGEVLAPVFTGVSAGPLAVFSFLLAQNGDFLVAQNSDFLTLPADFDRPNHIAEYANHLFLSFPGGSIIHSGTGEPLDYRAVSGAGEIGIGDEVTGFVSGAATAFIVLSRSRIDSITGTDDTNFALQTVSDGSGAFSNTAQMMDQPLFLDDGGVRRMSASQIYGDWKIGTTTDLIEPLIRAKREAGVTPVASVRVRGKAQYRMYWSDGTGIVVFFGRKDPESMPIKLRMIPNCACSGEFGTVTGRDRVFIGGTDGYVYEADKGVSFDGATIPAFMQFAWNSIGAPRVDKRFHSTTVELDAPDNTAVGVSFQVNYNRPGELAGPQVAFDATSGTRRFAGIDFYSNLVWTNPVQGEVHVDLQGIGQNIAITMVSDVADEVSHVTTAMTINYSQRRAQR